MKKIALFGTSADPPTAAHQSIISWLGDNYDRVLVWASDNPFKSHQTSLAQRETMLRLLIQDLKPLQSNIAVYPELSHTRTWNTVEQVRKMWGEVLLTLVVGSDLIQQLPRWYLAAELFQQVSLLIVPRPGHLITEETIAKLEQMGAKVAIAPRFTPDVSSTAYRESKDTEALTATIKDYIEREQLYRNPQLFINSSLG
jgi:nicotinate-nucleotide adenylyltransferase